jgi:hypothetical protein
MAESILKRIKVKEGEDLSDENVKKVIGLLEAETKITKKQACEMLKISYNTTRLDSIIEQYKHKKKVEAEQRAKNRGKPPSEYEMQTCIESYLQGEPITNIAKRLYRPPIFVKNVLDRCHVPIRVPGATFFKDVPLIPDAALKDTFKAGEIVYSVRYQSLARVLHEFKDKKNNVVYNIFLMDEPLQHCAYQPSWELCDLSYLSQYGVTFK